MIILTARFEKGTEWKEYDFSNSGIWSDSIQEVYRHMHDWLTQHPEWKLVSSHLHKRP